MKLPFIFSASGGGNSYHEQSYDQDDFDAENPDEPNEGVENFEDYMWMEDEEEFDKIELARLEEEALMKECMENMQDDSFENDEYSDSDNIHWPTHNEAQHVEYTDDELSKIEVTQHDIENSNLNPLAKEFFPSTSRLK